MEEVEQLGEKAERWRKLSWAISDVRAKKALRAAANELEERASELEKGWARLGARDLAADNDNTT
jgi:hypothetical protein